MKTLFVLILGIAIGAYGLYYYQSQPTRTSTTSSTADTSASARETADRAVAKTRAVAADVSETLSRKMQEWHLTPDDIRGELSRTGQVVRENSAKLRDKVSDARIVGAIKAKYLLEKDLPATAISVDSVDGRVTLSGALASEALVAKAVTLAMDTDGVRGVTSKIQIAAGAPAK